MSVADKLRTPHLFGIALGGEFRTRLDPTTTHSLGILTYAAVQKGLPSEQALNPRPRHLPRALFAGQPRHFRYSPSWAPEAEVGVSCLQQAMLLNVESVELRGKSVANKNKRLSLYFVDGLLEDTLKDPATHEAEDEQPVSRRAWASGIYAVGNTVKSDHNYLPLELGMGIIMSRDMVCDAARSFFDSFKG